MFTRLSLLRFVSLVSSFSDFDGCRVLVTGASGFLGTHLCRRLRALGAEVHAVSRSAPVGPREVMSWNCVDLADEAAARAVLGRIRPEVLFHLSGYVVGAPDLSNVLPTFRNDLMTAVNVLTFATEMRVARIVLAGSLEEPDGDQPPASPYAAAKCAVRIYSRLFHSLYGTPVATVRVFMTYGPGPQRPNKLLPYTIVSLLRGEAPKLSSGQRGVDWIYIDDVIGGLLAAGRAPGIEGGCFDLGSGELIPIRTIVQLLCQIIGTDVQPQFGAIPDRPNERIRVASLAESAAKLMWRPQTALEDGLRRTVEWYRNNWKESLAGSP